MPSEGQVYGMAGSALTQLAENANYLAEVNKHTNSVLPRKVTIIGGQDDEVWTTSSPAATVTADTANYKIGDRGWKLTVDGTTLRGYYLDCTISSEAIALPPASALSLWIYVPDPTKLTKFQFSWYYNATDYIPVELDETRISFNITTFVTGWNLLRMPVESMRRNDADIIPYFRSLHTFKIYLTANAATDVTIGHMYLECPEKAQILLIHDGGYNDFYTNAYPDLKARGIPCTWAIQPSRMGVEANKMTVAQVLEVGRENNNSVSFHSYGGGKDTKDMTAEELRADCMKSIKWLERHGFTGGMWRAAWLQNLAPQSAACKDLFLAFAMSNGLGGTITAFPFTKPYEIKRTLIHALTPSKMDHWFSRLQSQHSIMVGYLHNVNDDEMTVANWQYFLDKCTTGMNEGWLECVTMETLMARAGIKHRQGYGDWVTELYDEKGTAKTLRLP